MNKRIHELANQARGYADSHELPDPNIPGTGWVALFEQKFAELIVNDVEEELKDMAEWYSNNENYVAENTCYNFINHLNRMFRVKNE